LQLDVYGELLDALYACRRYGLEASPFAWELQKKLLEYVENICIDVKGNHSTRTDQAPSTAQPSSGARQWAYTAARIVLSARGAAEMLNMMQELHGLMLKQGYIQPQQPGVAPPPVPPAPETAQ